MAETTSIISAISPIYTLHINLQMSWSIKVFQILKLPWQFETLSSQSHSHPLEKKVPFESADDESPTIENKTFFAVRRLIIILP